MKVVHLDRLANYQTTTKSGEKLSEVVNTAYRISIPSSQTKLPGFQVRNKHFNNSKFDIKMQGLEETLHLFKMIY